jgi:protein MpaA
MRAIAAWKKQFKSDPRLNPGSEPRSEPETVFQEELISRAKPQKVLSIHAPLNFLDYDGPTATPLALSRFSREYVRECLNLRKSVRATSGRFYPGSLGNFSGQELGIPTLTLELPSADPAKAVKYWEIFSKGIHVMIDFTIPGYSGPPL